MPPETPDPLPPTHRCGTSRRRRSSAGRRQQRGAGRLGLRADEPVGGQDAVDQVVGHIPGWPPGQPDRDHRRAVGPPPKGAGDPGQAGRADEDRHGEPETAGGRGDGPGGIGEADRFGRDIGHDPIQPPGCDNDAMSEDQTTSIDAPAEAETEAEPEPEPEPEPWAWSGPLTTMGFVVAITVTLQFLLFLAEGIAASSNDLTNGQVAGHPFDVLHRIGYPFNLSRVAVSLMVLELIVAVVLVSVPAALERDTSDRHETLASVTLGLDLVVAPLIMIATVLAVRYNLRSFSIAGRSVPGFFRLELY